VITVGVDLAAADERSGLALVRWSPSGAVVESVQVGASDVEIVSAVHSSDKAGIDSPLGWPDAFVSFVATHRDGLVTPPAPGSGALWRRRLAYRMTDEVVRASTGLIPMSVSADRIGHAAFRAAGLLSSLSPDGVPISRAGDGLVVEVYPAASLFVWGLTHRGYKRAGLASDLVSSLLSAAPWLTLGSFEPLCRRSHDALDAVVAALAARAAATGRATRPSPAQAAAAATEGWIALPTCPIADLIKPDPMGRP
jgi:predicted nuclease with RNAse H fold